ncbi:hypothetical protein OBBRIDRAFT_797357 [Obba rivulosa]|uniref:Uncharacterized protein n=1 Tax=Obba rivulosa TaxID=1052685 RepID=A0A8E2DGS0_9APHY|nr:hypothetical protein OBBRIDRAFT_797357 [Obba rivulosa]
MRKRSNTYSGSAREGCTNPCKDLTERMVAPRPSLRLSRTESLVGLQIVEEPEEDGQGSSLADGCPNSSGTSGDISKPLDPCQPMTRQDVLTGRIFWASDSRRFGRSRPSRIRWQVQESTASSASVTEEKAVPADFSQPASSDST